VTLGRPPLTPAQCGTERHQGTHEAKPGATPDSPTSVSTDEVSAVALDWSSRRFEYRRGSRIGRTRRTSDHDAPRKGFRLRVRRSELPVRCEPDVGVDLLLQRSDLRFGAGPRCVSNYNQLNDGLVRGEGDEVDLRCLEQRFRLGCRLGSSKWHYDSLPDPRPQRPLSPGEGPAAPAVPPDAPSAIAPMNLRIEVRLYGYGAAWPRGGVT
jgi:hypothetical protein